MKRNACVRSQENYVISLMYENKKINMSDEVICISSSEDEKDTSYKQTSDCDVKKKCWIKENVPQKRKIILDVNGFNRKRQKGDKAEASLALVKCCISKVDEKNVTPTLITNKEEKSTSPQPGTSKYFDEIENQIYNEQIPDQEVTITPIKKIKPQLIVKEKVPIPDPSENIFEKFVQACLTKNKAHVKKIINNIEKRYNQLAPSVRDSDTFRFFLNKSLQKVSRTGSDKLYSYMSEVMDEIKRRIREVPKANYQTDAENVDQEEAEESEMYLSKEDRKKVKILDEVIEKLLDKIKSFEQQEVDFNDEEDSTYIKEDRYKRKLIELCDERSKIVGDTMLRKQIYKKNLRRKDIAGKMTEIPYIDEAIINLINSGIKKCNKLKHIKNHSAIADYLRMPDYQDILQCISKCQEEKELELSKKTIEALAQTAFKAIVNHLKKQRIHEYEDCLFSYEDNFQDDNSDPAIDSPELKEKLQKNKQEGESKLEEIFKKYVEIEEKLTSNPSSLKNNESSNDEDTDGEISEELEIENDFEKSCQNEQDSNYKIENNVKHQNHNNEIIDDNKKDDDNKNVASKTTTEILSRNVNSEKEQDQKNKENVDEQTVGIKEIQCLSNVLPSKFKTDIVLNPNQVLEMTKKFIESQSRTSIVSEDEVEILSDDNINLDTKNDPIIQNDFQEINKPILKANLRNENELKEASKIKSKESDSINKTEPEQAKSSFIKVRSFAKSPDTWKNSSTPEKSPLTLNMPLLQVIENMSRTEHKMQPSKSSTNTKKLNPLAKVNKHLLSHYKDIRLKKGRSDCNVGSTFKTVNGNSAQNRFNVFSSDQSSKHNNNNSNATLPSIRHRPLLNSSENKDKTSNAMTRLEK